MLNETRQNISTKESLLFCILGGLFVYFVTALPRILVYLFPPTQPEGISMKYYVLSPPLKSAYLISFVLFAILGICLLRKLNLKNRLAHFSLLGLILSMGGGILTAVLENFYYLFIIGDSHDRENLIKSFQENFYQSLVEYQLISWAIAFFVLMIPFTFGFLISTNLWSRIKITPNLK
jgi:hypothetical protein